MSNKTLKIDIEPKWIDIVNLWKNLDCKVSDGYVYKELKKMAYLCDTIRQAQKKNETLLISTINKEHTINHLTKDETKKILSVLENSK